MQNGVDAMQNVCLIPESIGERILLVEFQMKENGQMLALYVVVGGIVMAIIAYLLYKLVTIIIRYKRREIATRKDIEKRSGGSTGSARGASNGVAALVNPAADNEVYEDKDAQAAEIMDDHKLFTENIQRAIDVANAGVKNEIDIVDKTVISKEHDEY